MKASVFILRCLPLIFQLRDILDAGDDKIGTKPREAIKIFSGFFKIIVIYMDHCNHCHHLFKISNLN